MSLQPTWSDQLAEDYWQAIVTQGKWAEDSPMRDCDGPPPAVQMDIPSLSEDEMDERWLELDQLFNDGKVLHLSVTGYNKGGLLVDWKGMQGFVPISQMQEAPIQSDDCDRMNYLASYVDRQLNLKIIELDRAQARIIFSQRAATWKSICPDKLLQELEPGDICEGTVSNLCDFGVFVDLGGVDGLIHVSELSWQRLNSPSEVLTVGQSVQVQVVNVDCQRRRVALSLKRLQNNPWATVADRYRPGMVVSATITNVVHFGAFAQVEEGVEGLIHISELLLDEESQSAAEVIQEGDRLWVRVLSVVPDQQRMALSLRGIRNEALSPTAPYTTS
ncbi:MAG: S1 RNA-binding domain-containing protein [Anaerolineales bacterium]|nr:S1 RNA-binding domain-containing protein [Anaerolineales bacterium]MCB9128371.1 S1 RNA-binding domain-containing protein [Ardenticatenales bacterium]